MIAPLSGGEWEIEKFTIGIGRARKNAKKVPFL